MNTNSTALVRGQLEIAEAKKGNQKTLKDALALAAKNREFSEHLLANPEQLQTEYNLSAEQIGQLKNLRKMIGGAGSPMRVYAGYESE